MGGDIFDKIAIILKRRNVTFYNGKGKLWEEKYDWKKKKWKELKVAGKKNWGRNGVV